MLDALHRDFQAMPEPEVPNASLFDLGAEGAHQQHAQRAVHLLRAQGAGRLRGRRRARVQRPEAAVARLRPAVREAGSGLRPGWTRTSPTTALNHWSAPSTRHAGPARWARSATSSGWRCCAGCWRAHPSWWPSARAPAPLEKAAARAGRRRRGVLQLMAKQVDRPRTSWPSPMSWPAETARRTLGGSLMFPACVTSAGPWPELTRSRCAGSQRTLWSRIMASCVSPRSPSRPCGRREGVVDLLPVLPGDGRGGARQAHADQLVRVRPDAVHVRALVVVHRVDVLQELGAPGAARPWCSSSARSRR